MSYDGNTPLLPDPDMRALGFTDRVAERWYFCRRLADGVTFNVTITKATGNYEELVMDEDFGQPAYYGRMKPEWRDRIRSGVDRMVTELAEAGLAILVDHKAYGCDR
jgi:hypothetical protein